MASPDTTGKGQLTNPESMIEAAEIEEKHQEGGVRRNLTGAYKEIIRWTLVASSLFNLYTTGIFALSTMDLRGIHVLFMLTPVFIIIAGTNKSVKRVTALDLVLVLVSLASNLYILATWRLNGSMLGDVTSWDLIFGTAMILVILEASRRACGRSLTILTAIFLLYVFFGQYLPGILVHQPISFKKTISFMYQTTEGIYGGPIGVSSSYLVIFVLFGAFLKQTGAGQFFIDITYSIAGRFRGGPAKTAVVASSLMGMISGSPLANVVTVGTFTIPLMKFAGYRPFVAGSIEALASTGGNIMPPVMGAAAFIMADYLGISYGAVAIAALIPAILYYISVFMFCDLEALKSGMAGLPKNQLPDFKAVILKGWYLCIPLLALVLFLLNGWTPMRAAFWSAIIAVVLGIVFPWNRLTVKKFFEALEAGSREVIPVAIACAAGGIIVGALGVTGLGVKFTSGLIQLSGGNPFIALVLTMIAALILGIPLPITAVYILMATLAPPALVKMGISPLAAHMFIFYYSAVAGLTPPVALTAYAAAAIAGSDPDKTSWTSFTYGLVAYIVPFFFVYSPSLLMQGDAVQIVWGFITAITGTICFAIGLHAHISTKYNLGWICRLLFVAGGLLLIKPGAQSDIIGIVLVAIAWFVLSRAAVRQSWTVAA